MNTQPRGVLGIKTADGRIAEVLDFQNQKANTEVFTTIVDKQKRARFDFFYRERSSDQWVYLDNLLVNWIPPARAGDPDLEVLIRSDEQGNLVLGIDGPSSEKTQVFVLDAEILIAQCRRLDSRPVQAGTGRYAPRQQSGPPAPRGTQSQAVQARAREKKGGRGWIALVALVPALILIAVLIGPRFFSSASEEVTQSARRSVEAVKGQVKERVSFNRSDLAGKRESIDASGTPEKEYYPSTEPRKPVEPVRPIVQSSTVLETSEPKSAQIRTQSAQVTAPVDADMPVTQTVVSERPTTPGKEVAAQDPDWYRITWGDTLWRIAERFYGDRDLYNELADSNRLNDPDIIIAGEDLALPPAIGDKQRNSPEEY